MGIFPVVSRYRRTPCPRIYEGAKFDHHFFYRRAGCSLEKNSEALGEIAAAGHEIGNQSFHHEPWLHLHSEQKIEKELILAEDHIERVTGQHPHAGEKGDVFQIISTEKVQGVK